MKSNPLRKKIVFEGKIENNLPLIIRYPDHHDASSTHQYINSLSRERTFVLVQGEYISLKKERDFLKENIRNIHRKKGILLLAFSQKKLIGISDIQMKEKACSHEGILGISVAKEFRGQGVGTILLSTILEEAKLLLPTLKIVTLGVFACNQIARQMYKKHGFIEFGILPKGIHYKNHYIDHVYMYKAIR
ncbi:GNAT family N-acetyltransferase [Candidatus Gottesmanbacteria bacterium]|nr:GNAT family N-acetyltransferase [Candidatus Gottesmanbacteria bacterium]